MRRLSNIEYRFTVADLLGMPELANQVTATFAEDTESLGYRNGAEFLSISTDTARQYSDAADILSVEAVASRFNELVRCNAGEAERDCVRRFITSFGERAYRRPLTTTEVNDILTKSYDAARSGGYDFRSGIEWVIFGVLQSPQFLHRVEIVPSDGNVVRIRGYEMASRLSYLIWGSMPDDALLAAARNGELDTDEGVAAQADRLLADDKAHRMFDFFVEWLDLDRFKVHQRDPAVYGALDPNLGELVQRETETFVNHEIWEENGSLDELLTAPYTYMNQALAQHYGVSGVSGDDFVRVELDPMQRLGILMQTSMLTAHDKSTRTSIVRRGLKIRTDILCGTVGAPPDDAALDLPPTVPGQTQREMLEEHRTNVTCNACHTLMDPLGQVFESIDAVGRLRTRDEAGNAVDTSGAIGAAVDPTRPRRIIFVFKPNGDDPSARMTNTTETGFTFNSVRAALMPYKSDLVVLENIDKRHGRLPSGERADGHQQGGSALGPWKSGDGSFPIGGAPGQFIGYIKGPTIDVELGRRIREQVPSMPRSHLYMRVRDTGNNIWNVHSHNGPVGTQAPANPSTNPYTLYSALFGNLQAGAEPDPSLVLRIAKQQSALDLFNGGEPELATGGPVTGLT